MTDVPAHVALHEVVTSPGSSSVISPAAAPRHQQPDDAPAAPPSPDSLFVLGQNYPNPHSGETTVPFMLTINADVHLDLFDQMGRKMAGIVRKGRNAGTQTIKLNLEGLGLPAGGYIYRLQVSSQFGVHQQSKQMALA